MILHLDNFMLGRIDGGLKQKERDMSPVTYTLPYGVVSLPLTQRFLLYVGLLVEASRRDPRS